jgi:imidazolonepropionase-like amidohydrolase
MKRLLPVALACAGLALAQNSFLLRGVTVHPVTGPKLENVSVLVQDGRIADIGAKIVAPKTVKVIEGKGMHVWPGFIDSATDVGMSEISSIRETVDTGEIGVFNPQIRAAVAVNPSSEHFPVARGNGTTSFVLMPGGTGGRGPGGFGRGGGDQPLIQGQASMIHADGWTWEEMEVNRSVGIQVAFPAIPRIPARFAAMLGQAPGQQSFADLQRQTQERIKRLSDFLLDARRYQKAKAARDADFKTDRKFEAMLPVLEGAAPLIMVADRERSIREVIKFADEQKVNVVLAGARVFGNTLADLKAKNIPVILGPTYELPPEDDDPYDAAFTLPGDVFKAGVKILFGSYGAQFARNLPYNVANAIAFGLPYEEGIKALTINAAEVFGVADKIGSIEKGKWADLIVTDKEDPLETTTNVKMMFIKGRAVDLTSKHTKLYEKYLARP